MSGHGKGGTAHVGLCEVTLKLHTSESLKTKRGISKSLLARIRNRFNVSASEVGHLQSRFYVGLAFVSVSSSRKVVDSTFNEILQGLEVDPRFDVLEYEHTYL